MHKYKTAYDYGECIKVSKFSCDVLGIRIFWQSCVWTVILAASTSGNDWWMLRVRCLDCSHAKCCNYSSVIYWKSKETHKPLETISCYDLGIYSTLLHYFVVVLVCVTSILFLDNIAPLIKWLVIANWITPCSRVLLEGLIFSYHLKEFLGFYGNWIFVTVT